MGRQRIFSLLEQAQAMNAQAIADSIRIQNMTLAELLEEADQRQASRQ